jgi:hypothetical protein
MCIHQTQKMLLSFLEEMRKKGLAGCRQGDLERLETR